MPLILGVVGLVAFVIYECSVATEPVVPIRIFNRTSCVAYIVVFLHGIVAMAVIYYSSPIYFQAARLHSAIRSGVDLITVCGSTAIAAVVTGGATKRSGLYKIPGLIGAALLAIGLGLLTLLDIDSPRGQWVPLFCLFAIGLGALWVVPSLMVLAPLMPHDAAYALAFMTFLRFLGQAFGATIGATIIQNELSKRLPDAFALQFAQAGQQGDALVYAAIPALRFLNPALAELQTEVRRAFSGSIVVVYRSLIPIAIVIFLVQLAARQISLTTTRDERWGLEEREEKDTTPLTARPLSVRRKASTSYA